MTLKKTEHTAFSDSKNHYLILDGLRGVAAITVVIFHLFEAFANGSHITQIINHGYLAVDFFFVLSGFVLGYAYDDRWNRMSLKNFFKRRLVRLHPMIIMGMTIGAIGYYFSASDILYPQIAGMPVWNLLLIMFIGYFLLPVPLSMDIRGWQEMYPLNGPAWTLFFEYIANILYALFLRKLSNKVLALLVFISGAVLAVTAVAGPNGDVIGGWSLTIKQLQIGFTRLMYPFLAGLLLSRLIKPGQIKNAFLWCSLLIIAILAFPRVGGSENLWINGIYDSFAIILLFPFIVYMGASGEVKGKFTTKLCRFLGDISYPIYIIHYPLIYIFFSYVYNNELSMGDAWPVGLLFLVISILGSYASLKLYDEPVRKWLTRKFLSKKPPVKESLKPELVS